MDLFPANAAKVVPPSLPDSLVARPELAARLDEAFARRLTCVVAGAGYGKSTLLSEWASRGNAAWYTLGPEDVGLATLGQGLIDAMTFRMPGLAKPAISAVEGLGGPRADDPARADALADLLCQAIHEHAVGPFVLVIDDVHELPAASPSARLIESLCRRAPPTFHLVLASRAQPPFPIDRLRGRGQVLEIGAHQLAFSEPAVAAMLDEAIDSDGVELAGQLHALTAGWPAAVRLAVEALRSVPHTQRDRIVEGLPRAGGPVFDYLAREVFLQEGPEVQQLVERVAHLRRFNGQLCEELGVRGAADILIDLDRRGVLVEALVDGWFTLSALVRQFAIENLKLPENESSEMIRRAARWYRKNGHLDDALACFEECGDHSEIADLLRDHGAEVLARGAVDRIISASAALPDEYRDRYIDQIIGQARLIRADWIGALECFERAARGQSPLDVGLAWRIGLIHHLQGDFERALETYEQAESNGAQDRDAALLLAWKASVHWTKGETDKCRDASRKALEAANACGDDQALAAAHTVAGMQAGLDGDRRANDTHYFLAHRAAERAGDVIQQIRIGANRSAHHVEEGMYVEALEAVERVLPLAEMTGFATFLGLCFINRADSLLGLGRIEEAKRDYERAGLVYRRIGSSDVCYYHLGLGDVYRERGDLAMARTSYEEAVRVADEAGDMQGLIPALGGLARVLATEDSGRALELARRAASFGPNLWQVKALVALGWVLVSVGDETEARAISEAACAAARARRDRPGLAESLELAALSSERIVDSVAALEDAASIWREVGNPIGRHRAELALGLLSPAGARDAAEAAELALRELGVRVNSPAAGTLAALQRHEVAAVTIQCLGGLRLLREGRPVPVGEWQSRKARDLLKILVTRRGRMAAREYLMEALWPDEDPAKVANRLSVALTTVRSVLDPDRRFDPEHFIAADKTAVALRLENLSVDVEAFLSRAEEGMNLLRNGRTAQATPLLAAAEAAYTGDFLEEDPYEDWSVALREDARSTYISVARSLARAKLDDRDHEAAARYFLRILERDPYDEDAHLGLVATLDGGGRHGEARRCYRNYEARMAELGVEAAPFPGTAASVG